MIKKLTPELLKKIILEEKQKLKKLGLLKEVKLKNNKIIIESLKYIKAINIKQKKSKNNKMLENLKKELKINIIKRL